MPREIRLPSFLHGDTFKDDHEDVNNGCDDDNGGDRVSKSSQSAGGLKGDPEEAVVEEQDGDLCDGDIAGVDNLAYGKEFDEVGDLTGVQILLGKAQAVDLDIH